MSESTLNKAREGTPATAAEVLGRKKPGVSIRDIVEESSVSAQEASELDNPGETAYPEPNEPGSGLEDEDATLPKGSPPSVSNHAPPPWVKLPPDPFKLPRHRTIGFVRFRAHLTDTPQKGERQCIVWNLTVSDERLSLQRSRGDGLRTITEYAKQMIRVIDGVPVDRSGNNGPGNVDAWWNEIGSKCRRQLISYYLKVHSLTTEETADFFQHCVAVRTVGALDAHGKISRTQRTLTMWTMNYPNSSWCTTQDTLKMLHGGFTWTFPPIKSNRTESTKRPFSVVMGDRQ